MQGEMWTGPKVLGRVVEREERGERGLQGDVLNAVVE